MAGGRNVHGRDFVEVLAVIFDEVDEALVVDPTAGAVEALATADAGDGGEVRLLADRDVLKRVMNDFVVASNAADRVASSTLSVRTNDDGGWTASLVVGDGQVWALVPTEGRVAALATDDGSFVDAASETYENQWGSASAFDIRTPPLSEIRSTLVDAIGEETRADFDAALDSLTAVREGSGGFDEVMLTLLVAARNDVLLYDISKWGEDVGIASKATFSRTKTTLEEEGLIRTEKVPIDVGRPRLRLKLNESRFDDTTPAELAAITLNHSE
jgi:hypothetical protein